METVFDIDALPEPSVRRPRFQPEQKPISLVSFITQKFTKSREMVLDLFMDTSATTKLVSWSKSIEKLVVVLRIVIALRK